MYLLCLAELYGKKAQPQEMDLSCPGISLKLHTTIYIPEVMRNDVFPETSSMLSPVVLAILQDVHEL